MSGSSRTSTTQNTSSSTSPWTPQAGSLSNAFSNADSIYNSGNSQYNGDRVASYNQNQLDTYQRMLNYGQNTTGVDAQSAGGQSMMGTGQTATQGALSGYQNFDPTRLNNTGTLIDQANQMASGADIDAQVNNAMLNARQTARDVTLPAIEQAAARSGNTNSSRTGIAEGLVQRGLAQQASDLGASLRSQMYQNNLGLASSNANANNQATLSQLNGMGQLGTNSFNAGSGALTSSVNNMGSLFNMQNAGADGQRDATQATLDNNMAKADGQWDSLRNYMNVIGGQSYGSNSTGTSSGTQTSTPSAWQVLGGLMGGAGSLFGRNGFNLFGGGS